MEIGAYPKKERPIKILQFGEGNFMRGFADYMIDISNEAGVYDGNVIVLKPTLRGNLDTLRKQNCNYTVLLRGIVDGRPVQKTRVVTSIAAALECHTHYDEFMALAHADSLEVILSNVTEAGFYYDETESFEAKPPAAFPARLTKFLYERFCAGKSGLILMPCELIAKNGDQLRNLIYRYIDLWQLPQAFLCWIDEACIFCNTLVDRILTGFPKEEAASLFAALGYRDAYLDAGEPFALWVIESPQLQTVREKFPLDKANPEVVFTDDMTPYLMQKVRILNGSHTATVLAAHLAGLVTVGDYMKDPLFRAYSDRLIFEEIVPSIPLPREKTELFAQKMYDRFLNPYNKHYALTISLNSVSKWQVRLLPTLRDYLQNHRRLPKCVTFSLAALLAFYSAIRRAGDRALIGFANGQEYEILDDPSVLRFFEANSSLPLEAYVQNTLGEKSLWGEDLNQIPGFTASVLSALAAIKTQGVKATIEKLLSE